MPIAITENETIATTIVPEDQFLSGAPDTYYLCMNDVGLPLLIDCISSCLILRLLQTMGALPPFHSALVRAAVNCDSGHGAGGVPILKLALHMSDLYGMASRGDRQREPLVCHLTKSSSSFKSAR